MDVFEAIARIADETVLEAIAAYAHAQAENLRLKEERDWLKSRIADEDARLAHA